MILEYTGKGKVMSMQEIIIDGEKIHTKEELHKAFAEQFGFPEWYGGNLDALYDCLTELMEEVDIHILHTASLEEKLGGYGGTLLRVLKDAEENNLNIQVIVD